MPADIENDEDIRGKGFPQVLHDRARTAAEELHKLLLTLSTGAVGVFFIALTTKIEPSLTELQKACMLGALVLMGVAVAAGIVSWHADAQRNYFWAIALQKGEKEEKQKTFKMREMYLGRERISTKILITAFSLGMFLSLVYVALRVVQ